MPPRKLAILLFDDVEVLDFAGPFEVFAVSRDLGSGEPLFDVYTVAAQPGAVIARNGLSVNPTHHFADCPAPAILLVPGGRGTRREVDNPAMIAWIKAQAAQAELVLSVCTGALLLARAGVLAGLSATTYHTAFDELAAVDASVTLCPGQRWVDNGRVITSAGVSAGTDMALYVVEKLHGRAQASATARHMEYEYYPRSE